jgi:DNA ligase D-like protein (predicted ligase)
MNGWLPPMLATPTDRRFSDDNWVFERKLDGVRVLAMRDRERGRPQLWSRERRRLDGVFPEVVDALAELGSGEFVADGEIVALDGSATSYSRLRTRLHNGAGAARVSVHYYLFDLISLDGADLADRPLRQRKSLLRNAFRYRDPLRFSEHRDNYGEALFRHAREQGWEGLVAKRADSPYRRGRSMDWLTFDCVREQHFVVGGFTEPQGARVGFGALLVGYHDGDALRYAGKVGTGYDRAMLRALRARLDGMREAQSPFADEVSEPTAYWTRPEMVIRVGFAEWTRVGRLRHPRFNGIRTDMPPAEVIRETR